MNKNGFWRFPSRVNRIALFVTFLSAAFAALVFPASLYAQDTLVYSFETGLEGFTNNGSGTTVTQDTIGATQGTNSMKVAITGSTFVGAVTEQLHPAIGDPPGLDHVTFDLTITEAFPEGGFAVVGVMVFGTDQAGFDVQLQTGPSMDPALEFHIDGLAPGTYNDVTIDMTQFFHPVTFVPATFNEIVGTQGSGPNDMIPTGFQLYFNKTGGLGFPLTVYIDNIRVGMTPEASLGDYNEDGVVDAADYVYWRKAASLGLDDLPNDNDDAGPVGEAEYSLWRTNFGGGSGGGGSSGAVPEPASAGLLAMAVFCYWRTTRGRAAR
jgi:hypothetical protein